MCILSLFYRSTAQRIVRIMLIQPVIFIQHGCTRFFQRWNTVEQIPQTFEMILHLTSASHNISSGRIKNTITGTTCDIHCFQNVNMISRHLCIPYQEAGCCQRSQSASYQICMFIIYAFWFFRAGKCFIISICIIYTLAVFLLFAALGIAVIRIDMRFYVFFFLTILRCKNGCTCCRCYCYA